MAITYHQLGMTAQDRGRLDEADDWYRKSLTIKEELGDRPGMAGTYHQLGIHRPGPRAAGRGRGLVPQSPSPSPKNSATGPGMAITYHQLGITAQDRGRLEEAEDWYRKSLTIKEELGDRPGMALTYAQLGLLAEDSGQARWRWSGTSGA